MTLSNRYLPVISIGAFFVLGFVVLVSSLESQGADPAAEYVGQHTCMTSGCHSDEVGINHSYRQTMHARIHERPTPENVVIDRWFEIDTVLQFNVTQLPKGSDTLKIALSKLGTDDEYYFRFYSVGPLSDTSGWHRVVYNYGGNGWLQRFLVEVNGNLHVSPFQYVLESYGDREGDNGFTYFIDLKRWGEVDSETNALKFFDTTSQEFYNNSWDKNCSGCHLNGYEVTPDFQPDGDTIWRASWPGVNEGDSTATDINIAIGCESCHGPGSIHVADPENPEYFRDINPNRWDPTNSSRYWTDRKLDLCNQCHNRHNSTERLHSFPYDDATRQTYTPQLALNGFLFDSVAQARTWDDGVTSRAHHQTGQDYWRSSHYSKHVFKNGCYDCHSVHENTEYPYQLNQNWYTLEAGEGCVAFACHADKTTTTLVNDTLVNEHSKHHQAHSQCVNCHYTKTATISFVGFNEFSDHSDKVIRPTETNKYAGSQIFGMMNTCAASCHRNGYGSRNRPDAFDRNASIRFSTGGTPMRAPDWGIVDESLTFWKESSDVELADSLWAGYQRYWPQYVDTTEVVYEIERTESKVVSVHPNPATGPVSIQFDLLSDEAVFVTVFNLRGELVARVSDKVEYRGSRTRTWNLRDGNGDPVPGGLYFVRVRGETFSGERVLFVAR